MTSTVLTIGLVAAHANFLQVSHDWNYPVPVIGGDGNPVFGSLINGNIVPNPRLNPTWANLNMLNGQASSHYWGLQTGLNRRLSRGLQAQLSWTWSKSMDDSSGSIIGGSGFTNPTNFRSDYGLSNFDKRHNFRLSSTYEIPVHSSSPMLNALAGNWQVSVILSYLSGSPFSPSVGFASIGTGTYTPRPNVIKDCNLYPEHQTLTTWFNASCYAAPPIGEFGNAGRNTLIGPDLFNLDSSLAKNARITKFGEEFDIQFRAEFFNVTNHPSFAAPNSNLFTQGANGSFNVNPGVNLITATTSQPRQIQFGLKIMF